MGGPGAGPPGAPRARRGAAAARSHSLTGRLSARLRAARPPAAAAARQSLAWAGPSPPAAARSRTSLVRMPLTGPGLSIRPGCGRRRAAGEPRGPGRRGLPVSHVVPRLGQSHESQLLQVMSPRAPGPQPPAWPERSVPGGSGGRAAAWSLSHESVPTSSCGRRPGPTGARGPDGGPRARRSAAARPRIGGQFEIRPCTLYVT